ncbi:hypothetical protein BGX29_005478 [Mortierella sp. GBA35]|nr:hypothetical protein BGX23_012599 [Mortierella sp. AD031]KAF9101562.1 hypothetical protein BGX29_005478 [Mortierella sp. GBA35]KAG0204982.1 hypothetical protein BGX33_008180 [Mortierella sp. NVP41]
MDIVLWDDISLAFKAALYVRNGTMVLPFLKGADFKTLDPARIAAVPDSILNVVLEEPMVHTQATNTQEEQQQNTHQETKELATHIARRNPEYDPMDMAMNNLAHFDIPPPLPQVLLQEMPQDPTSEATQASRQEGTVVKEINSRRNPEYGLVEEAMENYSHMEDPSKVSARARAPQHLFDDDLKVEVTDSTRTAQPSSHLRSTQDSVTASGTPLIRSNPQDLSGLSAAKDITQTIVRASLGDMDAQFSLGDMYRDGQGVQQDYQAAMDWFLQAAEQGSALAQHKIGLLYMYGQGVPQDQSKAVEWNLKAAEQGDMSAQYTLGTQFSSGQGIPQDSVKAVEWFTKAARQGHVLAQFTMGHMTEIGQGVPKKDYAKAIEWYQMAADQGNASAQFSINLLHKKSHGA